MRGKMFVSLLMIAALAAGCASQAQKDKQAQAKHEKEMHKQQAKQDAEFRKQERRDARKRESDRNWEFAGDFIPHENEPRLMDDFARTTAANGAADDANFTDDHFNGGELNALGRSKLSLLLSGAKGKPVTVYLLGGHDVMQPRTESVEGTWKRSQYAAVPLDVKDGRNPRSMNPAGPALRAMDKMNNEQQARPISNPNVSSGVNQPMMPANANMR